MESGLLAHCGCWLLLLKAKSINNFFSKIEAGKVSIALINFHLTARSTKSMPGMTSGSFLDVQGQFPHTEKFKPTLAERPTLAE